MNHIKNQIPGKTGGAFSPVLFLALAFMLFGTSCEWFKPARDDSKDKVYKDEDIGDLQGTKVFDPETGEWRTVRTVGGKVDTIAWTDKSEDRFPPIVTDSKLPSNTGGTTGGTTGGGTVSSGTYNVSMLLPFLSGRSTTTSIDDNSIWGIQFYAGAKLAYKDLEKDGAKLNVNVADTDASSGKMNELLRSSDLKNANLIIGPYKREQVSQVAGFAKQNKVPVVVPYTAQMGMADNNPFYIQVNPSLKSHCEAILKHARKRNAKENIVLVSRDESDEKARLKYFQDASATLEGKREGSQLREFIVSGNLNAINVDPYIKRGKTTVFIVPSWSSEPFIYSFLRQLMIKQSEGEDIVVYGMPMWMDYEQIDFEYYERLNVHVSSAHYVDKNDERIRQFNQKFFDTYAAVPKEEAYLGYDVMLYFGKMINKWGKDFPSRIDQENFDVLHGRFNFKRVVLEPEKHREDLNYYDQLENTFVHILKFKDYHFQPAE
jgi:ABC-type branched-subunit amino acid transport system substrate-binding protein